MNRPLYQKTVDILFDAYFNDTLRHNNCYACACGNLIAAANGFRYVPNTGNIHFPGQEIVWDITGGRYNVEEGEPSRAPWYRTIKNQYNLSQGLKQIHSTGYNFQEFRKIEHAFESAPRGNSNEDWMFNGLCAVLEVLKDIHGVQDNTAEITRFTNHYQSITA